MDALLTDSESESAREPARAEPAAPRVDAALPLPAWTARDAALARLQADARLPAWLARFPMLSDWRATTEDRPVFERPGLLDLRFNGATARIAIDLAAFPALAVVAAPAGDTHGDASLSLRTALASALLAPLRAAFAAAGLADVTVGGLRAANAASFETARCVLSFALDAQPVRCVLVDVETPWIDALAARLRGEAARGAGAAARVPLPGRVRLGTRLLPLDVVRGLQPGDVLLGAAPAGFGLAPGSPLPAWWGARRATQWHTRVLIEGSTMMITEMPDTADDLDQPVVADDPPEPADLGALDLPVHIEIDTLSLAVAELAALRPGYVLELPLPARAVPVRLVAYGQLIGGGELVAVGAHLGVRINRMAGDDGSV
ncbi:type III secretion system cytoplasmic ring protein SctQ [Burkholderia alba]|uniref:type III secretion system cytoplasmic ring protein SctQ n=1 Tax=Burkholderia alba TaxID=2683677 RepID=UPI002B05E8EC|nr:type III secretion system cytoplasmic ring protein SctQ [Burkholderia alba]